MDILMVAAELGPYARVTDAGDSVLALAKSLRQLGHHVTLALPRYATFEAHGLLVARRLTLLPVGRGQELTVFDGQLSSGVSLVLFDTPTPGGFEELSKLGEGVNAAKTLEGADLLCRAAAALVRQRAEQKKPFDVVHLHDWPAALVPHYAGEGSTPSIFTVHDVQRQGRFPSGLLPELDSALPADAKDQQGICLLRAGVLTASAVTSVSPSYAESFTRADVAGALAEVFANLSEPVIGIAGGVDYAIFNPATDPALESRYDAEDPSNKGRTKAAVLRHFGLELELERPLAVFAGPLDRRRGADLILAALPELAGADIALAVAGRGDPELEESFSAVSGDFQGDVAFVETLDDALLRRLSGAADFVLVPSRYEPCGMRQLIAQRYGALPIACAQGGLIDTIVDADAALETGTGFLFDSDSTDELVGAVERAVAAYLSPGWPRLRRRAMRLDLSWDRAARRYAQVYRQATSG
jgi:starch synthase